MSKTLARIALAGLLLSAAPALAATANGSLPVTANVPRTCAVNSTAAVAFGDYNPIGNGDDLGEGTIRIQCTKGTVYRIALGDGANPVGPGVRQMKHASLASHIGYALFRDLGRTLAWGSSIGVDTQDGTAGSKLEIAIPVYGKISGDQDPTEGAYSDTVVVTVDF